jgi:hypothetical protein
MDQVELFFSEIGSFNIDQVDAGELIQGLDYSFESETRYVNPGRKNITSKAISYTHAKEMAEMLGDIGPDDRLFVLMPGSFIFGDFLEAWIIRNRWKVTEMTISTLGVSQENIDSLHTLIDKGYVEKLNMVVSAYFYAHERRSLVEYMYFRLDMDNKFQLAVARVHTKICLIKTACGKKIIIHGSANLRSSENIENIVIERDESLFQCADDFHQDIIKQYSTIKKEIKKPAMTGFPMMGTGGGAKIGFSKKKKRRR